jgi:hypothetical protein
MVSRGGSSLIDHRVREVVFKALDRPENPCVERRMPGFCKLSQCRNQEVIFESRVAIDIQAQLLALVGRSDHEFLEVKIEFLLLDLKKQASLEHLKFHVIGTVRDENMESGFLRLPQERAGKLFFMRAASKPVLNLSLDLFDGIGVSGIGEHEEPPVDKIIVSL